MSYRDSDELREAYSRLGSISKVADEYGVATSTIKRWLDRNGIETNTAPQEVDRIEVECGNCGKEKSVIPAQYENHENHYCDAQCQAEAEERSGRNSHSFNGGKVTVNCSTCGDEKEIYPSRTHRNNHFCSMDCRSEWQSENWVGEAHHQYERAEVECEYCGASIEKHISQVENHDYTFCDDNCCSEWKSLHTTGSDNPNWAGGSLNYGETWFRMRRKVRDRDENECQVCGLDEAELNKKPAVHHIKPVRSFDEPDDAHFLENMVQVCQPCHMKVEQLPEAEQRSAFC